MKQMLKRLTGRFPSIREADLDYSAASLNKVEQALLSTYRSDCELGEPKELATTEALVAYIGETFRRLLGGVWQHDPSQRARGKLSLVVFPGGSAPLDIRGMLDGCLYKRTEKFFHRFVTTQMADAAVHRQKMSKTPQKYDAKKLGVMRLKSERTFLRWLSAMNKEIAEFVTTVLPVELRSKMKWTEASLKVLEKWILDNYYGSADLLRFGYELTTENLSRYVGTSYIRALGGDWRWAISFDKEGDRFRGIPYLTSSGRPDIRIHPLRIIFEVADVRSGDVLRQHLKTLKEA